MDTLNKKKYRITIGNFSAAIIFLFAFYFFINPGPMGYGIMAGIGLALFCVIVLVVDFLLQKIIKNYFILSLIELILLILIFVYY